jgi:diacylglycerol kinase (ATP)
LVITNTSSGPGVNGELREALSVLEQGTSVEVATATNPGELDSVLTRAGSRHIVVAGGDGTLHGVLSALHKRHELAQRTLGLLPFGTGNDFARAAKIPLAAPEAAAALLRSVASPMPILVNEVGGVVAHTVKMMANPPLDADALLSGNVVERAMAVREQLKDAKALRLWIETDGNVAHDIDVPLRSVTLRLSLGSPNVSVEIERAPQNVRERLEMLTLGATELLSGRLLATPAATTRAVSAQQIQVAGSPFWCDVDGQLIGPERSRRWHVEDAAYQLLVR